MHKSAPKPHLVTTSDIFDSFDITKLKGKGNIKRLYKCSDKKALAHRIFLRYLHYMISDMIEGGSAFVFPFRSHMELSWKRMDDKRFKRSRAYGNYADIDVLASNFINYELAVRHMKKGKMDYTPIRLSNNYRDIVTKKINSGFKYC